MDFTGDFGGGGPPRKGSGGRGRGRARAGRGAGRGTGGVDHLRREREQRRAEQVRGVNVVVCFPFRILSRLRAPPSASAPPPARSKSDSNRAVLAQAASKAERQRDVSAAAIQRAFRNSRALPALRAELAPAWDVALELAEEASFGYPREHQRIP